MRRNIIFFLLCALVFIASGCGKKGPPMPPDEAKAFSQSARR